MKKYISACFLLLAVYLPAQKVKWTNDTVYSNSKPYCLLKKSGGLETVFSIQTLAGKEIAVSSLDKDVKNENGYPYYRVSFLLSRNVADFPNGLNLGKKLAEAVVASNLLQGDSLNPEGENRFLLLYPKQKSATINNNIYQVGGNASDYTTVERDRKGILVVVGSSIRQNNTEIGSCSEKTEAGHPGEFRTICYYLPNGTKCAEASYNGSTNAWTIHTFKDNSSHPFDVTNSADRTKEIAKWLVDNYYL